MRPRTPTPDEAKAIGAAVADAGPTGAVPCPSCGDPLVRRPVRPRPDVAYVRDRVHVVCPGCGLSGAVDRPDTRASHRRGDG